MKKVVAKIGMQGTPIRVVLLCWRSAGAPDAGRGLQNA